MRKSFLPLWFCVLFWCEGARSEIENEVKRGAYPFMAILYYPDETVVDTTGARFQHGAVLIKPEWLLSAAIDHSVLDGIPLGFPRKTLLARMGAMTLDANYTFNEDEDEQEREIIQIIKPSIHNKEAWWFTDITLLQTLVPFKLTSAIAPTNINPKRDYDDKHCTILVYAKKIGKNAQDDRVLMQLSVELLPPTVDNCGAQFSDASMTCAVPGDDTKNALYDTEFCLGNSGGPLMCEGEVMALQTYIENNCKAPHLYQLLASWDTMITCGVEQKCGVDDCKVCVAIHKDMATNETEVTKMMIQNDTTAIPSDTITTELPNIVQKKFSPDEILVVTEALETTSLETESSSEPAAPEVMSDLPEVMSTTSKSETAPESLSTEREGITLPGRSELSSNETPSTVSEPERRINYMDLFNRDEDINFEKVTETNSTSTSEDTLVETTTTERTTTSSETKSWPKTVKTLPLLEDDVTPKTRMQQLVEKPKYVYLSQNSRRKYSAASTIATPGVLTLVMLACLI